MNTEEQIASTLGVFEMGKQMFTREAIRSGDDNTLWDTMGACIRGLSRRFARGEQRPMEITIAEIHNIWFIFTLAISHIDANHPAQDRLIRLILWGREMGMLTAANGDEVTTSDGRLWADLPFIVEDVKAAWEKMIAIGSANADPMVAVKACNLAAGIARLAGLGIRGEAFTVCGVDIMRRALEEKDMGEFTILHLLAMVEVWLRYGGDKFFVLAGKDQNFVKGWNGSDRIPFGSLAKDAGLKMEGLSRERVLFWEQQLLKLKVHEHEGISATAQRCYLMIEWCCTCLTGKGVEAWATAENSEVCSIKIEDE